MSLAAVLEGLEVDIANVAEMTFRFSFWYYVLCEREGLVGCELFPMLFDAKGEEEKRGGGLRRRYVWN